MRGLLLVIVLVSPPAIFPFKDMGMPDWTCDPSLMTRSKTKPTSVHALRPADIDIVGALGDSLTAGNGAGAENHDIFEVLVQYRGLTFSVGGDKDLSQHISMANILKVFNPELFGYSINTGSANVWENAHLNAGVPGANSYDLYTQAVEMVDRMKQHPEIDFQNEWKLIHIFIGGNDMCGYCRNNEKESADNFRDYIGQAVQYLKDNLPRTLVVLTGMLDLSLLRRVDPDKKFCLYLHESECSCERNSSVSDQDLSTQSHAYMVTEQELQDSGEFDSSDDFSLVIAPFFEGVTDIARTPDGSVDFTFFAPDCFHFSAYGHAVVGKNLWNNLMQPVGSQTVGNLTDIGQPLLCPDKKCPFVRTTKNSANCAKYL